MKINQIIESKESLATYLALQNKAPINFKNKLNSIIDNFKYSRITEQTYQQQLDSLADEIESIIFSESFNLINDDPEIDRLIDDFNSVDEHITLARKGNQNDKSSSLE